MPVVTCEFVCRLLLQTHEHLMHFLNIEATNSAERMRTEGTPDTMSESTIASSWWSVMFATIQLLGMATAAGACRQAQDLVRESGVLARVIGMLSSFDIVHVN